MTGVGWWREGDFRIRCSPCVCMDSPKHTYMRLTGDSKFSLVYECECVRLFVSICYPRDRPVHSIPHPRPMPAGIGCSSIANGWVYGWRLDSRGAFFTSIMQTNVKTVLCTAVNKPTTQNKSSTWKWNRGWICVTILILLLHYFTSL